MRPTIKTKRNQIQTLVQHQHYLVLLDNFTEAWIALAKPAIKLGHSHFSTVFESLFTDDDKVYRLFLAKRQKHSSMEHGAHVQCGTMTIR